MIKSIPNQTAIIPILLRIFDPFSKLSDFLFYAKIIIALILILYVRKVLKLGTKLTLLTGALIFLVFFTDLWIFGSLEVIAITIIAFLVIGILGFAS